MMRIVIVVFLLNLTLFSHAQNYVYPPYTQDFEKWINVGGVKNVPDSHWINPVTIGNTSWRRNNDGAYANWTNATNGMFSPVTHHGNYCARFHASEAGANSLGILDLYLNFDSSNYTPFLPNSPYVMSFDRYLPNITDTLFLQASNNGPNGVFTTLRTITAQKAIWVTDTIVFTGMQSANTVLRFKVKSGQGNIDIGLDRVIIQNSDFFFDVGTLSYVSVNLSDTSVCKSHRFKYYFSIDSIKSQVPIPKLNQGFWLYSWAIDTDSNMAGGGGLNSWDQFTDSFSTQDFIDTLITKDEYLAVGTSYLRGFYGPNIGSEHGLTTKVAHLTLRPWYQCYCQIDSASGNDYFDIGNVLIELDSIASSNFGIVMNSSYIAPTDTFNNDKAVNFHSHYFNQAPSVLMPDSTYRVTITNISQYPASNSFYAGNTMYIDFNRNNQYELSEQVASQNVPTPGHPQYTTTFSFKVPSNALPGLTGMRVISLNNQPASAINSCASTYDYGEVEDYVISIKEKGSVNIKKLDGLQNIEIFPTTILDELNISANNLSFQKLNIKVYSLIGKEVYNSIEQVSTPQFKKRIYLPKLGSGIYFVQLGSNEERIVKKIMVK
jgi:hypothetical protein